MSNDDERKLRVQQEIFCINYVENDFNITQAAKAAGYAESSAHVAGSRLLKNAKVQAKIDELLQFKIKALNVTTQRVLSEMQGIAFADFKDAYKDDGTIKDVKDMPEHLRKAIASIEVDELYEGTGKEREKIGVTKKIKFWPKDKSLDQLGRYLKMFVDRIDHSGNISLSDVLQATWDSGAKKEDKDNS